MRGALAIRRADPVLAQLERARLALSQAKTIQAVKQIADAAAAARVYAKQQQLGQESIDFARAVQLEALRRLGQILKATAKATGGAKQYRAVPDGNRSVKCLVCKARYRMAEGHICPKAPPTLRELGVTKKESAIAQTLADLSAARFEDVREGKTSVHDVLRDKHRAARVERINRTNAANVPLEGTRPAPVLYADPPWQYEHVVTDSRAIENQYPTMTLDAICALTIPATDDAVLFLWATSPKLAEAIRVVEAWGFSYRTCMVWAKDKIGMGYYVRQQHELLLIAARGNLPVPAPENRPPSIIRAGRGEHSKKPDAFYDVIERMYPDFEKVELFHRGAARPGWQAWGNESAVTHGCE